MFAFPCSATKDANTSTTEPIQMGLDDCLEYIVDDELMEVGYALLLIFAVLLIFAASLCHVDLETRQHSCLCRSHRLLSVCARYLS